MNQKEKDKEEIRFTTNRIKYLKNSIDYNSQIIRFLDTKAQLIIITLVVFIPLVSNQLMGTTWENESVIIIISSIVALVLLSGSFIFSILVIISRTPEAPKTKFFGLDILTLANDSKHSNDSRNVYKTKIDEMDDKEIISDYCDQIYTLGMIMVRKFKCFQWAIYFLIGGIILSVGTIIVAQIL
ncbi:MAG: Pycsar system effector family protein [Candidatus Hodarchaeota archaeon]